MSLGLGVSITCNRIVSGLESWENNLLIGDTRMLEIDGDGHKLKID